MMSFFEELGIDIIFGVIPNGIERGLARLEPELGLIIGQEDHQHLLVPSGRSICSNGSILPSRTIALSVFTMATTYKHRCDVVLC